jgi:Rrf2 family transcriptional regulator, iron-sulfur cluster assembly transcription factor
MLSNTCRYAVRATIYLAVNASDGRKIGIKKISEDLDIPTPFLGKILQMLAKRGILSSTKGPHGGFGIGKDPNKTTLFEIVDIIDGDDLFNRCLIGVRSCKDEDKPPCAIHDEYVQIREEIKKLAETASIQNLADNYENAAEKLGL